jgi:tRNA pseudouridine55 synthase
MNAPRTRVVRRPVHGVLLLDKPLRLSSNDALQKAKWLLRAEKAGHTGTLDPLATGVLPLCFGAATKFSSLQLDAVKTYTATVQLGVPMYSALKKDGKALYEYARAGIEVERDSREVQIYKLNLAPALAEYGQNAIEMVATVSKGTYIRTLGEDIGHALGCGAHLRRLRRVETGGLGLERAVSLANLEAMSEPERLAQLLPVDSLLAGHTPVMLDADNAGRFLSGLRRRTALPNDPHVVVYADSPRALLGSAHIAGGELIPSRLLSPIEIQQILVQNAAPAAERAEPVLN